MFLNPEIPFDYCKQMVSETKETFEICTCICREELCNKEFPGCKNSEDGIKIGNLIYMPAYGTDPVEFENYINKNRQSFESALTPPPTIKSFSTTLKFSLFLLVGSLTF